MDRRRTFVGGECQLRDVVLRGAPVDLCDVFPGCEHDLGAAAAVSALGEGLAVAP